MPETTILDAVRKHLVACAKAIAIDTMRSPQTIELTVHPEVYHALATEALHTFGAQLDAERHFPKGVTRYFVLVDDTVRITIHQGTGR